MPRTLRLVFLCIVFLTKEVDSCLRIIPCRGNFLGESITGDEPEQRTRYKTVIAQLEEKQIFNVKSYTLNLTFDNATHYTGNVDIYGAVPNPTRALYVNVDSNYVTYDYETVSVSCCDELQPRNVCIRSMTRIARFSLLEMQFSESIVEDWECSINFDQFRSYARRDTPTKKAVGLRISGDGNFTASTTSFRMNYARTVFPCLDYPAVKATFIFCINYPPQFTVVSNVPAAYDQPRQFDGRRIRQCFRTDYLPTYMFSFALLYGYVGYRYPDNPTITLYVPRIRLDQLTWIAMSSWEIDFYLSELTGQSMPSALNYVVLFPAAASVESYSGMIFLNGSSASETGEHISNKTLLYVAILRQYIGGCLTTAHWNEICLEEGLVKYFEMLLHESLPAFSGRQRHVQPDEICATFDKPLIESRVALMDGDNRCGVRAGAFFKGTAEIFGSQALKSHLRYVCRQLRSRSFDIEMWASLYNRCLPGSDDYNDYLKWYFESTEPMTLSIRLNQSSVTLDRSANVNRETTRLPIPLKIYYSSVKDPVILRLTEVYQVLEMPANATWAFVDPDGSTCITKIYDDLTYARLLNPEADDPYGHLTLRRQQGLANRFCDHLLSDKLVFDNEKLSQEWKDAADYVNSLTAKCRCCLTKPQNRTIACSKQRKQTCDNLRFVNLL